MIVKIFMDDIRAYRLNNHIHVGDFTRSGSCVESNGKEGAEVTENAGTGTLHENQTILLRRKK
jgi:hypothetical protein